MKFQPANNWNTVQTTAQKASVALKAAGMRIAKNAERTTIVAVTLPRAYAELGRAVYENASLREGSAGLYEAIDALLAERRRIEDGGARSSGSTLADKAKKAAADAADLAKMKAIDIKIGRAHV